MPTRIKQMARLLFHEQDGRCHYCGMKMTTLVHMAETCTVDHIRPQSVGGGDGRDNLVGACWSCNNLRQDMPYEEFIARRVALEETRGRRQPFQAGNSKTALKPQRLRTASTDTMAAKERGIDRKTRGGTAVEIRELPRSVLYQFGKK